MAVSPNESGSDLEDNLGPQGHDNPGFVSGRYYDASEDVVEGAGTGSTRSVVSDEGAAHVTRNGSTASKPAVVVVRNGNKAYDPKVPVLTGFNMTVDKGSIYGLLGSSGCGKTTILSCIVGVRQLDSGSIHVFGSEPGTKECGVPGKNIGYMPQDISLYGDFSINETLNYFGSLYCLDKKIINKNRKWLIEFLALPDPSWRVGDLSGGQKRRVSMAVALIHDPPLLILDEPTVGVDPLLRESIWNHLVERVTKHHTTVIITTHYIEEARQSHKIGLMRNGKLLAEKPPDDLIREHNASNLEDVVLELCRKDAEDAESPEELSAVRSKTDGDNQPQSKPIMATLDDKTRESSLEALKRVSVLAYKNAVVLIRNYLLLIFMIWVPACQVLVMCLAIGNDPKPMRFGVVNHEFEQNNVSNCEELLELGQGQNCSLIGLSCGFLDYIPDDYIHAKFFKTDEEATNAVKRGQIWGYMKFPADFSSAYWTKVASSALSDEETLIGSSIHLWLDETSKQISGTLKKELGDSLKDYTKTVLKECGYSERLAELPLQVIDPIYGTDDTDSREFMSSGIMIAILFFFPLITAGIQYIYEKKLGTLERTLVAGVNTWEIMAGFSITTSIILFVQTMLALMIVTVLFQIQVQGSFLLCVVLGILVGLAGVSMGFLIGSFCKEEVEATMLSIAMFFPVVMLSGILWPLEGMPKTFQYFSYFLPCQLPAEALRSIISRGWSFTHFHVWPGFLSIVGWIVVYWLLTMFLHKKKLIR